MERKNENSSAEGRDIPAICPAVMVDMEREVPGNTAEKIWQMPIQIACHMDISSMRSVLWRPPGGVRPNIASTIHMITPPTIRDMPITYRLSRCFPITLVSRKDGTAVNTNAMSTNVSG